MKKWNRWKTWLFAAAAVLIIMGIVFCMQRRVKKTAVSVPAESAQELSNPDRGIYHLYQFRRREDAVPVLSSVRADKESALCLLEINLEDFRSGEISQDELSQIDALLSDIGRTGKRIILRFLYDWYGTAASTEPDSVDTVLRHMEQVGPVLIRHSDSIYTLQGLFIGNWGEMNGGSYTDAQSLRTLAKKLQDVTEGKIRLSVRTPQQWRVVSNITSEDLSESALLKLAKGSVIGLFNDGLTGSATDYGTYAADPDGIYESRSDAELLQIDLQEFDPDKYWPRDAELAFQEKLCRFQPCGGEAIHVSDWNDLDQAVRSFRRMHVTYLNLDYDRAVWDKWASETISEKGVFDGMQGDDYIRCHLGYRFVLTDAELQYHWWKNKLSLSVSLQNRGFAPASQDMQAEFLLLDSAGHTVRSRSVRLSADALTGGVNDKDVAVLKAQIPAGGLDSGSYRIALRLLNEDGDTIFLGNEGREKTMYPFGSVSIR